MEDSIVAMVDSDKLVGLSVDAMEEGIIKSTSVRTAKVKSESSKLIVRAKMEQLLVVR